MPDLLAASHPWLTPLLIFTARLCDVTLSTVRILFVARGLRYVAPLVGFVEILIWLVAISQALQHLDHPLNYVAYAAGFAAGTYAGMFVEGKLALGLVTVRIITEEDATDLVERLRGARFGVTSFSARGSVGGRVRLLLTVAQRRDLDRVLEVVRETHPQAFVSVSDVRTASEGYIVDRETGGPAAGLWRLLRRTK
jgi:uncharacterized protein YebE (UPF0316 family)